MANPEAHVRLADNTLKWADSNRGIEQSVPLDRLVAIFPPTADGISEYQALCLDGSQSPGNSTDHDFQLTKLSIPNPGFGDIPELQSYICQNTPAHLQTEVHVVVSTLSGTQGALPFFENALKPLLEHLRVPKYQVHKTQSARTILELCEQIFVPRARDGVEQTIILLSGDGGVIDIIAAFSHDKHQKTPPTICLIPMGTGNATANSALASDSTFGLSALIRGTPRVLPTFKATLSSGSVYLVDEGRQREPVCQNADDAHVYGAVVLSWGMHASLVADADTHEYRKFGVDRFKMAAKELLWPSDGSDTHHYSGTVTLTVRNEATRTLETVGLDRSEHMYILTTMVSQLEKGFAISPASKPLDGQLRLVHFGVLAPERAMELMGLAYQGGKHVSEPEVSYEAVEKVRIEFKEESERWRRVCIDGKIAAVSEGGWLEIEKADAEFVQLVVSS